MAERLPRRGSPRRDAAGRSRVRAPLALLAGLAAWAAAGAQEPEPSPAPPPAEEAPPPAPAPTPVPPQGEDAPPAPAKDPAPAQDLPPAGGEDAPPAEAEPGGAAEGAARDEDARGAPAAPPEETPPPDDGSAARAATSAREREVARLEEITFLVCDLDATGWLSFREASDALGLDRSGFAGYDRDLDGRIDREEFGERYRAAVDVGGTLLPAAGPPPPVEGDPPQAWDLNRSGALELAEVRLWLSDGHLPDSPDALLAQLDRDGSGRLELAEFEHLVPPPPEPPPEAPRPRTLVDVFGGPEPRPGSDYGGAPPPRLPSPATHFRRLDLDGDGYVELAELALLRPAHVPVREAAVLAALDQDGDGRLSEVELESSLGGRRR